jgi:hypothetical protein
MCGAYSQPCTLNRASRKHYRKGSAAADRHGARTAQRASEPHQGAKHKNTKD